MKKVNRNNRAIDVTTVGGRIKKLRTDAGYTQEELATRDTMNITLRRSRLSGVTRATIPDKQSHLITNYCTMF